MTVIFVVTKNKYFNVIEEIAQTMCMDFINDIVWCVIDCLYQIMLDMFLCFRAIPRCVVRDIRQHFLRFVPPN